MLTSLTTVMAFTVAFHIAHYLHCVNIITVHAHLRQPYGLRVNLLPRNDSQVPVLT